MSDPKRELLERDDAAWAEVRSLVDGLTPDQLAEPGYYPDWSVKDLMAHLGSWFAEAAVMLERMRMGTYRREPIDVDALNAEWLETWREKDLSTVKTELMAARARMLDEWDRLGELDDEALRWFRMNTTDHYPDHVPRLREWVASLRG